MEKQQKVSVLLSFIKLCKIQQNADIYLSIYLFILVREG